MDSERWAGSVSVRLLTDRRRHYIFLGRTISFKRCHKATFTHDANAVAESQNLRQIARNHQDRHVLLSRELV
jgi:DNA polymerase III psi subunit